MVGVRTRFLLEQNANFQVPTAVFFSGSVMDEEMCWLQSFCSLQPLQPRNSQAQAVFGENRWMFLVKLGRNLTRVPHLNFREIWVTYYSRNGQDVWLHHPIDSQNNLYR